MDLPLAWALLVYLLLLLFFFSIAGMNLYHIARFGHFDVRNRIMVWIYGFAVLIVLGLTAAYCMSVDWSQQIALELPKIEIPSLPTP